MLTRCGLLSEAPLLYKRARIYTNQCRTSGLPRGETGPRDVPMIIPLHQLRKTASLFHQVFSAGFLPRRRVELRVTRTWSHCMTNVQWHIMRGGLFPGAGARHPLVRSVSSAAQRRSTRFELRHVSGHNIKSIPYAAVPESLGYVV